MSPKAPKRFFTRPGNSEPEAELVPTETEGWRRANHAEEKLWRKKHGAVIKAIIAFLQSHGEYHPQPEVRALLDYGEPHNPWVIASIKELAYFAHRSEMDISRALKQAVIRKDEAGAVIPLDKSGAPAYGVIEVEAVKQKEGRSAARRRYRLGPIANFLALDDFPDMPRPRMKPLYSCI